MAHHAKSALMMAAAVMAVASTANAADFKQVGTIPIPGEPLNAFGALFIDQRSGLGFLADRDNKGVVVFDTKTDKFVSRITGFVGVTKRGDMSGPNGVLGVNDGAELWVSDGDSTIKVIDPKAGTITAIISTDGKRRANAMAFDPNTRTVIVANANDEPTFLSLVSTEPGNKVLAKLPVEDSAENIERSAYHAPSGMFYTAIPVLRSDRSAGGIVQTDPKTGKIVKLHVLSGCHPHGLAVVSDTTIFLGCSSAHGPDKKPGGDLGVFDVASGTLEMRGADLGGNGDTTIHPALGLYYHSTTAGELKIIDIKTRKLVQKIPTSPGARSLGVSRTNNRVYVAMTAKDGPCGGCIVVYARE